MYHISESEFMQYQMAERRLRELREHHAIELQEAYDGIHPTRTCLDYQLRKLYPESVNPAEYAIYLIELKEKHRRSEKWWEMRAEAYKEAFSHLTEEERLSLNKDEYSHYIERQKVSKKLRELLSKLIVTRPELQRKFISMDDFEDVEEYDRRIDEMRDDELFEDYWDLDEQLDEERLKKQCFLMYDAHGSTYKEIGELLGLQSSRVKRYVEQHQREVS